MRLEGKMEKFITPYFSFVFPPNQRSPEFEIETASRRPAASMAARVEGMPRPIKDQRKKLLRFSNAIRRQAWRQIDSGQDQKQMPC
jgi:hypothetical protein